jgi:hypothetical protein
MVSRPRILASMRAWREGDNGGQRLGVAHGRERRCLNKALDHDVAVTAKMSSYHGAPRPTRVRAAPRTDRRSAACTTHVWCNGGERPRCLGRGVGLGKARGLGRRATSGGGASGGARTRMLRVLVRGRGVAAHSAADPFSIC